MPPEDRQRLVRAVLMQLPEQSSPLVIVVKPDQPRPNPIRTAGHRNNSLGPVYDPSAVFILELATVLSTRDAESVALVGQSVADALQNVVRNAANVHSLILSRAVYYLLYFLNASQVRLVTLNPYITDPNPGALVYTSACDSAHYIRL